MREAEQMKYLYETLNQASLTDSNRFYQSKTKGFLPLEPRRSNPLDRYFPSENSNLKNTQLNYHTSNVHNQTYHENREQNSVKQLETHAYGNLSTDDEPVEHYLQVDPRCYVRQKSNISVGSHRKSETPRLEKGLSLNVDTRSTTPSSLSPYRQSSFDVTLACRLGNQTSPTPSPAVSTQQDIYFTPRGSSMSVMAAISTGTPPGSQHLSPPVAITSRQNSLVDKKDLNVTVETPGQPSIVRTSIVQREHEHSRSLEHSTSDNPSSVDKQFRSFDAVHLLRPVQNRDDLIVTHRTKSYTYDGEDKNQIPSTSIAPPPIVIKIPDMSQLVHAVQLSQRDNDNSTNKNTRISDELWPIRRSYEYEDQQQFDGTSPEDFSPDLLTSTSIDSAGAMAIEQASKKTIDDDLLKYDYRRKSSTNLLVPPPEIRRQALRRTYEKRRRCINQSNARREQESLTNQSFLDDDVNQSSTMKSTDFSSLLNNFNTRSENSSFDRSLETDFDVQSDTSSRGPTDHFTSIESSVNENGQTDVNHPHYRFINQTQKQISHQDDSGYKSYESQNSQTHTFSLDWMSAECGDNIIPIDKLQQDEHQRIINVNETNEQQNLTPKHNFLSNKLVTSSSFNRTASKKRREFGKDKRHASSNVILPQSEQYQISSIPISQIKEMNNRQSSSSTLQVRRPDLRRSKSDQADNLEQSIEVPKPITPLSSSADRIIHSHTNQLNQIFPSSINPQIIAFRSKRGSVSFDNPMMPISSPSSTSITKPRLKFSMVRDTTTTSLGSTSPSYTMPLAKDYSLDEKTNQIINEYLMKENSPSAISPNAAFKRSQQQIRQQTFDETTILKSTRKAMIKERQHSFIQPSTPSIHLFNPDNSNKHTNTSKLSPQIIPIRRDNGLSIPSPSIIVTGYDSGS